MIPDDLSILKGEHNEQNQNIKRFQHDLWHQHFDKLVTFLKKNNAFPNAFFKSTKLFGWIKRQRCQYKLFQRGKKSAMTKERIELLNSIGFVWDQQGNLWERRFQELVDFKKKYGNCLVPHEFGENQKLANWVKIQRRQYILNRQNRRSNMTLERIQRLERLGFVWTKAFEIFESAVTFVERNGIPCTAALREEKISIPARVREIELDSYGGAMDKGENEYFKKLNGVNTEDDIRVWIEIVSDLSD